MLRLSLPSLALFFCFALTSPAKASSRDYAVEVQAEVRESPPLVRLTWRADPAAPFYAVYKKQLADTAWNEPIALLPGSAQSFEDGDVSVGRSYEYSLQKSLGLIHDTVTVVPGRPMTFTIRDSWGDGMCCENGVGHYRVEGCGTAYASGGAFAALQSTSMTVEEGDSCAELIVSLTLDVFGQETTWSLTDDQTQQILGQGGPYAPPHFGHILAGIRVPAPEQMGAVLLLVQGELAAALAPELSRLELDLIREGYRVHRRSVGEDAEVPEVKALILAERAADPALGTLFLLGHIPVPYSGDVQGVHADQRGAWPADLYYGELDGAWPDSMVENTSAARPENHNVPGDGKFDPTFLPSDVDLAVGRVDLSRMPAFALDHAGLLKRYLDKDHAWRTGQVSALPCGLIDDHVGEMDGTAYAACGWRNFTAMFGPTNVFTGPFFPTLEQQSYVWVYGCAPSSYTNCMGVASTVDFAARTVKAVFVMMMGSYFGDWDNANNVLRAPLGAQGLTLASMWSGRPTWILHPMALGYPLGLCARLTQNNHTLYTISYGGRQIHTALMGDPTLTMFVVRPPETLRFEGTPPAEVRLTWSPSPDSAVGYQIYRAATVRGEFTRITAEPVVDTTFTDTTPLPDVNVYSVRALRYERSASGTFFHLSPGVLDSVSSPASAVADRGACPARADAVCHPNPFTSEISFACRLPADARVVLEVLDVSGRTVARPVEGSFPAGLHTWRWKAHTADGRPCPSGIYYYCLRGNDWTCRGRLCLIR